MKADGLFAFDPAGWARVARKNDNIYKITLFDNNSNEVSNGGGELAVTQPSD